MLKNWHARARIGGCYKKLRSLLHAVYCAEDRSLAKKIRKASCVIVGISYRRGSSCLCALAKDVVRRSALLAGMRSAWSTVGC